MSAGRNCPLSYRYAPQSLQGPAFIHTETLYVVGGLYGNEAALSTVVEAYTAEPGPKHLIFNGDFNWFDIDPASFSRINRAVLSYDAIRGNVETELAPRDLALSDAGCGCGYSDSVDDGVVQRSNAIMQTLAATATAFPALQARLAGLPMWKRIDVAGVPIAVVHGDAQSLAGWGFAAENLALDAHQTQLRTWFEASGVRIFACSHTCEAVFHTVEDSRGRDCLIANNGAAGMPNFAAGQAGLLTRIATTPYANGPVASRARIDDLFIEAVPIAYDQPRWHADFLAQWPSGSPAHESYWKRITDGPTRASAPKPAWP
ncbi:MAG: hypothetical protein H7315_14000 [Herminiimonas sp.]|nr:hypothetical protein [Herminiimonas sp.]